VAGLAPVPKCLRVNVHWTVGVDLTAENVLHFSYSGGPPSTADCSSLASAIFTPFSSNHGQWPSSTALTTIVVTDLDTLTGASGSFTGSTAGTRAGAAPPASACAVVGFSVAQRYRGGKGKVFLPWLTDSDMLNNQLWQSTAAAGAATAMGAIAVAIVGLSAGTTNITQHVVTSYFKGYNAPTVAANNRAKNNPKPKTTPDKYAVTGYVPQQRIGSQRKRLRR